MNNKRTLSSYQQLQPHIYLTGARSLQRINGYPKCQQKYINPVNLSPTPPVPSRLTQSIPHRLQFHSPSNHQNVNHKLSHHNLNYYQLKNNKETKYPAKSMRTVNKQYNSWIQNNKVQKQVLKNNAYVIKKQKQKEGLIEVEGKSDDGLEEDFEVMMEKSAKILGDLKKKLETVRGVNKELILENCKLRGKLNKLQHQH